MNILYIQSDCIIHSDVESAFEELGYSLVFQAVPPVDETASAQYLQDFLAKVRECSPAFVFSLGFYPFVSLACGALGIPYVSWLYNGYDREYYSPNIKNEWNYIFTVDSSLCKELKDLGVKHVFFLPLAAPISDVFSGSIPEEKASQYCCDISFIGSVLPREEFPLNPLSQDNELKDSTKGYLEGCIACQYQLHSLPSICSNLPSYVWDDLTSIFPPQIDGYLENAQQYYEHTYFNDLITHTERDMQLGSLASAKQHYKIFLYNPFDSYSLEGVENKGWADYHTTIPLIAGNSLMNLVITHRNYKAAIPPTAWAIMASKGFLLGNWQEDYSILSTKPVLFHDKTEMLDKAAYYYQHPEERTAITEPLYQELLQQHTYTKRIEELLSYIQR